MPQVELQRPLSVPAVPARSAASHIIHAIADRRAEWGEFSLYLNFGSLGFPDVGYVAIPVTLNNVNEKLEPRHEISFTLRARRVPEAFPTFDGGIGIDANGPSNALLWVAGQYEVPMGNLGGIFNQLVARGSAAKALENMMNELAGAIEARVQQRERADARYRVIFNTGD
jgi:hypothetical protein